MTANQRATPDEAPRKKRSEDVMHPRHADRTQEMAQ